jgi:glycerol-3-phosphate dehydrogenase
MKAEFDLLIIGGGITGAGIARLAARNGLRVALLERGDLMSGASSSSSHMLHGGLRYLEHGRFTLIRESLEERAAVSHMAPALATPRRFLVPVVRGGRFGRWRLRAGLQLYDWLAGDRGFSAHSWVNRREALELEPAISPDRLRGAGIYSDVVMDDARIGIAVARDAVAHGATIHTYQEVTGARPAPRGGLQIMSRSALDGLEQTFYTRVVVNATGPWTDATRHLLRASLEPGATDPAPMLRPSRGVHLLYPALTQGHGLLLTAEEDGRVFFVVPMGEYSLVGTTEIEVASPLSADATHPTIEEARYLRRELRRALPGAAGEAPIAVLSGVRPLMATDGAVGEASREHRILEENDTLTIAGGKFTTFRVMARDIVERVQEKLGRAGRSIIDSEDPLPVSNDRADATTRAREAVEQEMARRLEDVMRRRTTLWMQPDRGRSVAPEIAKAMAQALGWDEARRKSELEAYEAQLWEEELLLQRSREDP